MGMGARVAEEEEEESVNAAADVGSAAAAAAAAATAAEAAACCLVRIVTRGGRSPLSHVSRATSLRASPTSPSNSSHRVT